MAKHPLIILYKTNQQNNPTISESELNNIHYPFILFVGREPNGDKDIGTHMEWFDFDDYKNCQFWNNSYSIISSIIGLKGKSQANLLKEEFRKGQSSFIAFADISSKSLNYGEASTTIRKQLESADIQKHLKQLLENNFVKNNVDLIIFTGSHSSGFGEDIINYANKLCPKKYVHIDYVCNTRTSNTAIRAEQLKSFHKYINNIYIKWKDNLYTR